MAKEKPPYRKLTRMSRTVGFMTQLWMGEDHLLHVQSTGYTENYQRFYLRDIQGFQIIHTSRRLYIALILGGFALFPSLIALGVEAEWPVYAIIGALILPFLIWNQLAGPGCRVVIVTAVQQEKLPSLSRLRKTRRVIAELKPMIEAAQADLTVPRTAAVQPPLLSSEPPPMEPPSLPPPLPVQ